MRDASGELLLDFKISQMDHSPLWVVVRHLHAAT